MTSIYMKNNLFLLSKHVLPADLEPARPISFFHISCLASFLAFVCSCLLVPFSSVLLFIPFILLFLVFCLFIPLYSCHLCFLESSFIFLYIFLSFSSRLQSLLSSGLDFNVLFFPSLDVALCWFFRSGLLLHSEREREREGGRGRVTFINNEASLARQVRHTLTLR